MEVIGRRRGTTRLRCALWACAMLAFIMAATPVQARSHGSRHRRFSFSRWHWQRWRSLPATPVPVNPTPTPTPDPPANPDPAAPPPTIPDPPAPPQCMGSFLEMGDIGISPITLAQSIDGKLYMMDRRDLQNSKILMPDGSFAHAVEYDIGSNTWRAVATATNTWCSAGGYLPDGTILNTAGNDEGRRAVRLLRPCSVPSRTLFGGVAPEPCNEWWEDGTKFALATTRWYPTDIMLPDSRHFVVGGSSGGTDPSLIKASYEFVNPYTAVSGTAFDMPFLLRTVPNYLYPFCHLLPTDKLFIFANVDGIIFDYKTNTVLRDVPAIPDGISRSYPSTASSLLMALDYNNGYTTSEVLICGGNSLGATKDTRGTRSCWLCKVEGDSVSWAGPYNMARERVMPDLLYLTDGTILVINGAQTGIGGFGTARDPNLWPEILQRTPDGAISIQSDLCASAIARGYHSEAILIPDGRVFLAGSNPNGGYVNDSSNPFKSEFRIEMFSPPYLSQTQIPRLAIVSSPASIGYGATFTVTVSFPAPLEFAPSTADMRFAFIANSFTTHSLSMSLRYINSPFTVDGYDTSYTITATSPPNSVIAPPGPYMLAVTYRDIPAVSRWIIIG